MLVGCIEGAVFFFSLFNDKVNFEFRSINSSQWQRVSISILPPTPVWRRSFVLQSDPVHTPPVTKNKQNKTKKHADDLRRTSGAISKWQHVVDCYQHAVTTCNGIISTLQVASLYHNKRAWAAVLQQSEVGYCDKDRSNQNGAVTRLLSHRADGVYITGGWRCAVFVSPVIILSCVRVSFNHLFLLSTVD